MAGVLVDVLLERLATLALDKIESELKRVVGVKKEVENLTSNLEAIKAVLQDAEQRQVTEDSVRLWVGKLNQVSFEMDDVLDEWITQVEKHNMEKQENQGEHPLLVTTTKKKACFPFSSCCFCSGQVNQLKLRRDIAERIKDLNEKIDLISKQKQVFSFQDIKRNPDLPQRPKTTSFPEEKPFGRDEEIKMILSKLLGESSEGGKRVPPIIPIVGMGGMGKTTLAQLVYNDERVKSHFDCRMWVCVSDPFEELKIARAIVEGLGGNSSSDVLQTLMQRIDERLKGKKYLLVLDDVWHPTQSQWDELIKPLRTGALGSRVMVTTRIAGTATLIMKTSNDHIVHLKELREDCCLALFYYNADIDEGESSGIQDIGKKIVNKCKGLPLAAKTLGSHMRGKKTNNEWQDVLDSKIWKLESVEEDVFRPLLLSYHDLAPAIKRCLLYCVVFPKDYQLKRDNLIELWSSQDYLNVKENNTVLGKQYFDNLVMRSFFQECEEIYGNIRCKMHDIIHDFLQYLTKNECKIIELGVGKRMEELNDKVHHLTLMHSAESECLDSLLKCKNLRTFAALDRSIISSSGLELIVQLKCLRTLNLSDCDLRGIPEDICGLLHLRYLDLSDNGLLAELPDTMGSSLYNLQTLRLINCESLEKVDLRGLINLRHLLVDTRWRGPEQKGLKLMGIETLTNRQKLIKLRYLLVGRLSGGLKLMGIETLTNLQTLDWFYGESNKVEDLKDLNQLQGSLIIHGTRGYSGEKAAIMRNKERLQHLSIGFSSVEDRELLDALQPHPALESFAISFYEGTTLTTNWWSSLINLTSLTIQYCSNCEFLPPLGKLASLESLTIWHLDSVRKVGVEFLGIDDPSEMQTSTFISFPKLKRLTFYHMESWESWEGVEEDPKTTTSSRIIPCLSTLTITYCGLLEQLPDFLWKAPLQTVDFTYSRNLQNKYGEKLQEMKMEKETNDGDEFIFHAINQ